MWFLFLLAGVQRLLEFFLRVNSLIVSLSASLERLAMLLNNFFIGWGIAKLRESIMVMLLAHLSDGILFLVHRNHSVLLKHGIIFWWFVCLLSVFLNKLLWNWRLCAKTSLKALYELFLDHPIVDRIEFIVLEFLRQFWIQVWNNLFDLDRQRVNNCTLPSDQGISLWLNCSNLACTFKVTEVRSKLA